MSNTGVGYTYVHSADRRLLPPRVQRDPRRRESRQTCAALLAPSPRLVRRPQHHRRARPHRQRLRLPQHTCTTSRRARPSRHTRIRPFHPQTNGKVERFNRTLLDEWAYVRVYRSEQARTQALTRWLHLYNHHRSHTALGGQAPIETLSNLPGHYN